MRHRVLQKSNTCVAKKQHLKNGKTHKKKDVNDIFFFIPKINKPVIYVFFHLQQQNF